MAVTRCVFSDLDGTIVHYEQYPGLLEAEGPDDRGIFTCQSTQGRVSELLRLPPSQSGAQGVISVATLRLFAALRSLGVKVVLISGARSSTLLQRLPQLPLADAYVCESGGRIFFPDSTALTAAPITEDLLWRRQHEAAAGPLHQDAIPPAQRAGALWHHYAGLQAAGWNLDAVSYTTAFRVKATPGKCKVDIAALQRQAPRLLASAANLGVLDFFPATSGKESAARYLMHRFGVHAEECVLMCDDDNDLALARLVRKAYLPGITAESVQEAVDGSPDHFYVSQEPGWRGTEEILRRLLQEQLDA